MEFDDIIKITGQIGPFIFFVMSLASLNNLFAGLQTILPNFLSPRVDHWCSPNSSLSAIPANQQKYLTVPYDATTGKIDACRAYDVDWSLYRLEYQ